MALNDLAKAVGNSRSNSSNSVNSAIGSNIGSNDYFQNYYQQLAAQNEAARQAEQQQQAAQQAQTNEVPYFEGGSTKMNDFENALHFANNIGEGLANITGWQEALQETKAKADEGKASPLDWLNVGTKFMGSLPTNVLGVPFLVPQGLYEGISGVNLAESVNGYRPTQLLNDEQKQGQLLTTGIDAISMLPWFAEGRLLSAGGRVANTLRKSDEAIAKASETIAKTGSAEIKAASDVSKAADNIDDAAKTTAAISSESKIANTTDDIAKTSATAEDSVKSVAKVSDDTPIKKMSWEQRVIDKVAPNHPFAAGLALTAASESAEEAVQSVGEQIRGYNFDQNGDANGRYGYKVVTDPEELGKTLEGVQESAVFGALGGAGMHAGIRGLQKIDSKIRTEATKRMANRLKNIQTSYSDETRKDIDADVKSVMTNPTVGYGDHTPSDNTPSYLRDADSYTDSQISESGYKAYMNQVTDNAKTGAAYSGTQLGSSGSVAKLLSRESKTKIDELVKEAGGKEVQVGLNARGNEVRGSSVNIGKLVTTGDGETVLNALFDDPVDYWSSVGSDGKHSVKHKFFEINKTRLAELRAEYNKAIRENDNATQFRILNEVLMARAKAGCPVVVSWYKLPSNNDTPVVVYLTSVTDIANTIEIDSVKAKAGNSDFDGDLSVANFDPDHLSRDGQGRRPRTLVDALMSGKDSTKASRINWMEDIPGWDFTWIFDLNEPRKKAREIIENALDRAAYPRNKQREQYVNDFAWNFPEKGPVDSDKRKSLIPKINNSFSALSQKVEKDDSISLGDLWTYIEIENSVHDIDKSVSRINAQRAGKSRDELTSDNDARLNKISDQRNTSFEEGVVSYGSAVGEADVTRMTDDDLLTSIGYNDDSGNPIFRQFFLWIAKRQGASSRGILTNGKLFEVFNAFDSWLFDHLGAIKQGQQDAASLIGVLNAKRATIFERAGYGSVGMNAKVDFNDSLVEELDEVTRQYNDAVEFLCLNGTYETDPSIFKQKLISEIKADTDEKTKEAKQNYIAEMHVKSFGDVEVKSMIPSEFMSDEYEGMSYSQLLTQLALNRVKFPTWWKDLPDSHGETNTAYGFLELVRSAHAHTLNSAGKEVIKHIGSLGVGFEYTEDGRIKHKSFKDLSDEERDKIPGSKKSEKMKVYDDYCRDEAVKVFQALGYLYDLKTIRINGLLRFEDFKKTEEASILLDPNAKEEDKLNVVFTHMLRSNVAELMASCDKVLSAAKSDTNTDTETKTDADTETKVSDPATTRKNNFEEFLDCLVMFAGSHSDCGPNPMFTTIFRNFYSQLIIAGKRGILEESVKSGNPVKESSISEEDILNWCSNNSDNELVLDAVRYGAGEIVNLLKLKTSLESKLKSLNYSEDYVKGEFTDRYQPSDMDIVDSNTDHMVPWITVLKMGLKGDLTKASWREEVFESQKRVKDNNINNAIDAIRELDDLCDFVGGTDKEILPALRLLADPSNIQVDDDILLDYLVGNLNLSPEEMEKARSVPAAQMLVQALRKKAGKPISDVFHLYSGRIGSLTKMSDFKSMRDAFLGIVLGMNDPKTGAPWVIHLVDDSNYTSVDDLHSEYHITEADIFEGYEDGKGGYNRIAWLKDHPNIVSWLRPSKIVISGTSGNPSISEQTGKPMVEAYKDLIGLNEGSTVSTKGDRAYQKLKAHAMASPHFISTVIACCDSKEMTGFSSGDIADRAREEFKSKFYKVLNALAVDMIGCYSSRDIKNRSNSAEEVSPLDVYGDSQTAIRNEMCKGIARRKLELLNGTNAESSLKQSERMSLLGEAVNNDIVDAYVADLLSDNGIGIVPSTSSVNDALSKISEEGQMKEEMQRAMSFECIKLIYQLNSSDVDGFEFIDNSISRLFAGRNLSWSDRSDIKSTLIKEMTGSGFYFDLISLINGISKPTMQKLESVINTYCGDNIVRLSPSWFDSNVAYPADPEGLGAITYRQLADHMINGDPKKNRGKEFVEEYLIPAIVDAAIDTHLRKFGGRYDAIADHRMRENIVRLPEIMVERCQLMDPNLLTDLATIEESRLPKVGLSGLQPNWGDPVISACVLNAMHTMQTAESAIQVGTEGTAPNLKSAFHFMDTSSFDCGVVTTQDIVTVFSNGNNLIDWKNADPDFKSLYERDDIPEDRRIPKNRRCVYVSELKGVRDIASDGLARFTEIPVIGAVADGDGKIVANGSETCLNGFCTRHNPGFATFIQDLMSTAQEGRTMKLVKVLQVIETLVKGELRPGNETVTPISYKTPGSINDIRKNWTDYTNSLNDRIKDATKSKVSQFGGIDEKLGFDTHGLAWAKAFCPAIKFTLKDSGDTFCVSTIELFTKSDGDQIRNPFYDPAAQNGEPHYETRSKEFISMSDIGSYEIRVFTADEIAFSILRMIRLKRDAFVLENGNNEKTPKSLYADAAAESQIDYSWKDKMFAEDRKSAIDDVFRRIPFRRSSYKSKIPVNMGEGHFKRFNGLSNPTDTGASKIVQAAAEFMPNDQREHLISLGLYFEPNKGKKIPLSCVYSNYSDNTHKLSDAKVNFYDDLKRVHEDQKFRRGELLYSDTSVIIDYTSEYINKNTDEVNKAIQTVYASKIKYVLCSRDVIKYIRDTLGIRAIPTEVRGIHAYNDETYWSFDPSDDIRIRQAISPHGTVTVSVDNVGGQGLSYFVESSFNTGGEHLDSLITVYRNMRSAKTVQNRFPGEYKANGTLVRDLVDIERVQKIVGDVVEKFEADNGYEGYVDNKASMEIPNEINTSAADGAKKINISPKLQMARIQKYINKVITTGTTDLIHDVEYGDVIGIAWDERSKTYTPVFFEEQALGASLVRISDTDEGNEAGKIKFYYDAYSDNDPTKRYLVDIHGQKAYSQLIVDNVSLDIPLLSERYDGEDSFKLSGGTDPGTTQGRMTKPLQPRQRKLALYYTFRDEYKKPVKGSRGYNMFSDKDGYYIEDEKPDGTCCSVRHVFNLTGTAFSEDEVKKYTTSKTPVNFGSPAYTFWSAVADGKVTFRSSEGSENRILRIAISNLVRQALNCGYPPARLFTNETTRYINGKHITVHDGLKTDAPSSVLAGVDVIQLCAFLNWCDPKFVSANGQCTDEELLNETYVTDKDCRVVIRCQKDEDVQMTGGDFNEHGEARRIGYLLASRDITNGSVLTSDLSDSASWNSRMDYIEMHLRGVYGGDPDAVYNALMDANRCVTPERFTEIYIDDDDYVSSIDPARRIEGFRYDPYSVAYVGSSYGGPLDQATRKLINIYSDNDNYYTQQSSKRYLLEDGVPSNIAFNQIVGDAYLSNFQKRYGRHWTKSLIYEVAMANANQTMSYNKGDEDAATKQIMTVTAFRAGLKMAEDNMNSGRFPISTENIKYITLSDNTHRISLGACRRSTIAALCRVIKINRDNGNPITFNFDEEVKRALASLDDVMLHYSGTPNTDPVKKNVKRTVDFMRYSLKCNTIDYSDFFYTSSKNFVDDLTNDGFVKYAKLNGIYSPSLAKEFQRNNDRIIHAREAALQRLHLTYEDIPGSDVGGVTLARKQEDNAVRHIFDSIVKLRQMNGMLGLTIPVANAADGVKTGIGQIAYNQLGMHGFGPAAHLYKNKTINLTNDEVRLCLSDKNFVDFIYAYSIAYALGQDEDFIMRVEKDSSFSPTQYIEEMKKFKISDPIHSMWNKAMSFGSANWATKKIVARNFLYNFIKNSGKYDLSFLENENGFGINIHGLIASDRGNMARILMTSPLTNQAAKDSFNLANGGVMGQEMLVPWVLERICGEHKGFQAFLATMGGAPFIRSSNNITFRTLKRLIPGMSSLNYMIVSYIEERGADFWKTNPLGKIATKAMGSTPENIAAEFALDASSLKLYSDIRESLWVDVSTFGFALTALTIAAIGAVEPPDDDDLYGVYEEWTFLGMRIEECWWIKDIIGPILPLACHWRAMLDGKGSPRLMTEAAVSYMSANPYIKATAVIDLLVNPETAIEAYDDVSNYYSDTREGSPSEIQYIMANSQAAALSYFGALVTPRIFSEISEWGPTHEKSYTQKYVTDAYGNPIINDDYTQATEKVGYEDAMIRKVTRNNPLLAIIMDIKDGVAGNNIGYGSWEMPNQVVYDSEQLNFMHQFSVVNYETDQLKSEKEIRQVCDAILYILETNNDMDALWKQGFILDKTTKECVTEYLWSLYQQEITSWNKAVMNGETNYYKYGSYEEGQRVVTKLKEEHYAILQHYKDLYYDKLSSDDLNQGLVKYNRYNTTYRRDDNGNWYASGSDQRYGMFGLAPFLFAPTDDSVDDYAYATRSAVTGDGMYNENGTPMRALEKVVEKDDYEWKSFDELSTTTGTTNGTTTSNTSSGSKSYSRRSGGGGSSRGGGSSYSSRSYAGSTKYATATNGKIRLNGHNLQYNKVNYGNTMNSKRIYDADLEYLKPTFETKGSRKAYKRQDF